MKRRPQRTTRTDPRLPYATLFRSRQAAAGPAREAVQGRGEGDRGRRRVAARDRARGERLRRESGVEQGRAGRDAADAGGGDRIRRRRRSEEHTSELQSLMRISYAVFCLKKKKNNSSNDITSS